MDVNNQKSISLTGFKENLTNKLLLFMKTNSIATSVAITPITSIRSIYFT